MPLVLPMHILKNGADLLVYDCSLEPSVMYVIKYYSNNTLALLVMSLL